MGRTVRTFRIFVSSTFSDLKEERNALQKEVFRKLRELCTRHGCRFQAIDLRWGVPEEAGLDQQTMKICLDEVDRSQKVSPRPNFIILLGDRYGWRPLPAEIDAHEFTAIQRRIGSSKDSQLLQAWYHRDDNAVPAVYCLKPRENEFADYLVWENEVERPLRLVLKNAISDMELSAAARLKYEASATEQEIEAGSMSIPDAREHVFAFFRTIKNLPRNQKAKDFLDLDEKLNVDEEAAEKIQELKRKLKDKLGTNVSSYEAEWTAEGMSTDHIPGLCADVLRTLSKVIEREIASLETIGTLEKEIIDQDIFGSERAKLFVGRTELLERIEDYFTQHNKYPLVIYGDSGSGKTALLAKAASLIRKRYPETHVIVRFVGSTPGSSDGRSLLESICRQISQSYGEDETAIPSDYRELIRQFPRILSLSSQEVPLVVFVDALDQLPEREITQSLTWMANQLPNHARLIVSTVSGTHIGILEKKLPQGNVVKLESMSPVEGQQLLDVWLTAANRTLQTNQRDEILTKFLECPLPLYLKFAFEEARRWKSHTPAISLRSDIPGIIRNLFARLSLEANHGQVMVSRFLSYLAASKNGLSEDELLDLLSGDEVVLGDFKRRSKQEPPEARLPVVVWSRLYFDVESYLTERSGDGATLLGFYHRQPKQVVDEDYLGGQEKQTRHRSLANYFKAKQVYEGTEKVPNLRRLSELPYQLTWAEMWEELHTVLTDFEFLEAKCAHVAVTVSGKDEETHTSHGGVYELQKDYRFALQRLAESTPQKPSVSSSQDL